MMLKMILCYLSILLQCSNAPKYLRGIGIANLNKKARLLRLAFHFLLCQSWDYQRPGGGDFVQVIDMNETLRKFVDSILHL